MIKQVKKWYILTENGSPVSISEKSYNLDRQGNEWQEVEVIPVQSVQSVAEQLRGLVARKGGWGSDTETVAVNAHALIEAADQLTSFCTGDTAT